MANPYFVFKQFTVFHDRCAMKVGTDGVLLGAWVNVAGVANMLDVGTGTGLIALMMAQRSEGIIYGVELDESAFLQAGENVKRCPWTGRIKLFHNSFQQFARDSAGSYDLVVSNPPYFRNSLKPPAKSRSLARHDDHLSYESLLFYSSKVLSDRGRLAVILPADGFSKFELIARFHDLLPMRITHVRPQPGKDLSRCLAEFSRDNQKNCHYSEIAIRGEDHNYTKEYLDLTRDFYLDTLPE
ncbi:MAG: methyltransferase [Bacteroidales bacterium]